MKLIAWGDGPCSELDRFGPEPCEPPATATAFWAQAVAPWCVEIDCDGEGVAEEAGNACDWAAAVAGYDLVAEPTGGEPGLPEGRRAARLWIAEARRRGDTHLVDDDRVAENGPRSFAADRADIPYPLGWLWLGSRRAEMLVSLALEAGWQ